MDPERPESPDGPTNRELGPPERVQPARWLFAPRGVRAELLAALVCLPGVLAGLQLSGVVDLGDVSLVTAGIAILAGTARAALAFGRGHERTAGEVSRAPDLPAGTDVVQTPDSLPVWLRSKAGGVVLILGVCALAELLDEGDVLQLSLASIGVGGLLANAAGATMLGVQEREHGVTLLVEVDPAVSFDADQDDDEDEDRRFYVLRPQRPDG